jgi:hypothetical protein
MFVNFLDLIPGQKIRMKNQALVEVLENMGDGIWVRGKFLQSPTEPEKVGEEDLCYCEEVLEVVGE